MIPKKEDSPFTKLCKEKEHWETPQWAAEAILDKEILTQFVSDPCCGTGILSEVAEDKGYTVTATDIHDWGYPKMMKTWDFMDTTNFMTAADFSVIMNPPFSLAQDFVDRSLQLGARKIVCFQRFAWYEGSYDRGKKRGLWWEQNRPARIWICGDRADCWRHDIPVKDRNTSTPTAHAWFVWERGHGGTQMGHIYKPRGKA